MMDKTCGNCLHSYFHEHALSPGYAGWCQNNKTDAFGIFKNVCACNEDYWEPKRETSVLSQEGKENLLKIQFMDELEQASLHSNCDICKAELPDLYRSCDSIRPHRCEVAANMFNRWKRRKTQEVKNDV